MASRTLFFQLFLLALCFPAIAMPFSLSSGLMHHQSKIPAVFTCHGANISPDLFWRDIPAGTQSLALIVSDPDAPHGIWYHWGIFNLPPVAGGLNVGQTHFPASTRQAKNSWGNIGYAGPCPPSGGHHYHFSLYALDIILDLPNATSVEKLLPIVHRHIIQSQEIVAFAKGS